MSNASITSGPVQPAPLNFLKRVLWADAAITGSTALLQLLELDLLGALLGLPRVLLLESAGLMLASSFLLAWLAWRLPMRPLWIGCVIGLNVLWTVACAALLFSDALAPTLAGQSFIAMQGLTTGLLAVLEWIGLRKAALRASW